MYQASYLEQIRYWYCDSGLCSRSPTPPSLILLFLLILTLTLFCFLLTLTATFLLLISHSFSLLYFCPLTLTIPLRSMEV